MTSQFRCFIADRANYVRRMNRLERARRTAVITDNYDRAIAIEATQRRIVCTRAGI